MTGTPLSSKAKDGGVVVVVVVVVATVVVLVDAVVTGRADVVVDVVDDSVVSAN